MAWLIPLQTMAILVSVFAVTTMGKELIGKEKRSELSEEFLAALGGIPKSGPAVRARSLSKEARSVSDNSNNGINPNCINRGSSSASGGNGQGQDGYSWELGSIGDNVDWPREAMMSSGIATGYSGWTLACAQILAFLQFIFFLVSMA